MRAPFLATILAAAVVTEAAGQDVEEVVVEAATDADDVHAVVIDADAALPGETLGDALQRSPGAHVRGLGGLGAWSGVSLRGSAFRQVEVRLDGVPLNPDGIDAVNLSAWPLSALSEVRVFRGRVPASFGASPIGGLVDLVTPEGRVAPRLRLEVGSFESVRGAASGGWSGDWGATRHDGFVGMDVLSTQGRFPYVTNNGTPFREDDDETLLRRNNARYQLAGLGRWRFMVGGMRWTLLDAVAFRTEGLPGPIGNPAEDAALTTTRNLLVLQGVGQVGPATLGGQVWHLVRSTTLDDRLAEVGVGAAWQTDTTHALGGQLHTEVTWGTVAGLRASAQGRWERFSRRELTSGDPADPRARGVAGAAIDVPLRMAAGRLRVVPGVDLRVLVQGDDTVVAANPGLSLDGEVGRGVVLRASGGRGFRPPDLSELYGNRGAFGGNANLRPEASWQGELGLGWRTPTRAWLGVQLDVAGFVRQMTDRITWVQNAQRTLVPVNFGEALLGGAEASLGVQAATFFHAQTALSWNEAINQTPDPALAGKQLPFVPRLQLDHRMGGGWQAYLQAGWTLHVATGVFTDAANVGRQADRVFHGLYLRSQPGPQWPRFEFAVHNLADRRVQEVPRDPLRPDGDTTVLPITDFLGYPVQGRTLTFAITWTPEARR